MTSRQRVVWTAVAGLLLLLTALTLGIYFGAEREVPVIPLPMKASTAKEHPVFSERTFDRRDMVAELLRARDIQGTRVLDAMTRVPRHAFVPAHAQPVAYNDHPIRIGNGQTISQPYIVAFMSQALGIRATDRALEVGTGSGYQAAVLAELAQTVYTIEILPDLAKRGRLVLSSLGYKNIHYRIGDGYRGWPEEAPFDAIMVTAAPGHVPQPLLDQLAMGGRLIIPVGKDQQTLMIMTRTPGGFEKKELLPVRFVPMTGQAEQ